MNSASVVPSTVIASASSVPSISALPDISKVAASNSPDKVMLVAPVIAPSNTTAPLISTVVSEVIVSTPSEDWCMNVPVSPNYIFSVLFISISSENLK